MGAMVPTVLNILRPDWMTRAACVDMDLNIFFPGPGRLGAADTRKAVAICAQCPVRQECLDYALQRPDMAGVWGGTSHRARVRILKSATPVRYSPRKPIKETRMTDPDQSDQIRNLRFQVDTLADHRAQLRKALAEIYRALEESPNGIPFLTKSTVEVVVALKLGGFND
jgi:WhiB family redox-sensing transcriptional regulator